MSFEIFTSSAPAALAARDALAVASAAPDERRMAAVAKQALFTEALLGAIRARINEFKAVAK